MYITLRFYLMLLGIAFAISSLVQFLPMTQEMVSSPGIWNLARGWQNEIAIWNICLVVIIWYTLKFRDTAMMMAVAHGVMVLTLFLSVNHMVSVSGNPGWHIILAALNFLGFLMGVGAITRQHVLNRTVTQ